MSSLYKKLIEYSHTDYYPFHMPGHKRNTEYQNGDIEDPISNILPLDITEIDGFDNLHDAHTVIREAEEEAALLYGSEHTHFLINGSTCGILAAITAFSSRGDTLIIARNCHRSVYNAALLNRLNLVYIYPDTDDEYNIRKEISPEDVRNTIKAVEEDGRHPAGIVITSPTYEGVVSDTCVISQIAHEAGIPVLIDEAHGAHFGFAEGFPDSSVPYADIVIHSIHKTLPAPTQTALIHVNGEMVSDDDIGRFLSIYETSSPSYVLMAGIDRCINILKTQGEDRLKRVLCEINRAGERLLGMKHLKICPYTEPLKFLISVKGTVLTGENLSDILRRDYHIETEMFSDTYALCIFSMMDSKQGIERLTEALLKIDEDIRTDNSNAVNCSEDKDIRLVTRMSVYEASNAEYETVDLCEAEGRISNDYICAYPPGIPIVVPGEEISHEAIELILRKITLGLNVQGIKNNNIKVVGNG